LKESLQKMYRKGGTQKKKRGSFDWGRDVLRKSGEGDHGQCSKRQVLEVKKEKDITKSK